MDIVGAKALKRRLGPNRADEAPPGSVDVPEDAPPVFHWVGIGPSAAELTRPVPTTNRLPAVARTSPDGVALHELDIRGEALEELASDCGRKSS